MSEPTKDERAIATEVLRWWGEHWDDEDSGGYKVYEDSGPYFVGLARQILEFRDTMPILHPTEQTTVKNGYLARYWESQDGTHGEWKREPEVRLEGE